jgi:battenin
MPFVIPLTYFLLLPSNTAFLYSTMPSAYEDESLIGVGSSVPYTPLANGEEDQVGEEEGSFPAGPSRNVALSASDKLRLVRPMLLKYMLPLCKVTSLEFRDRIY